jgi:hypothetical protein
MGTDTEMETFLSGNLDQVPKGRDVSLRADNLDLWPLRLLLLPNPPQHPANSCHKGDSLVGTNTGSLKSLRAQLLILVGNQVDAQWELVDVRTLSAQVEDSDLGIRDTSVEPRLRVRLWQQESVSEHSNTIYTH